MNLAAMDVKRLMDEPSAKVRGMLAAKVALDYRDGHFSSSESSIAIDIFRILIRDTERQVRQSLSQQLAHCSEVPRDIILKLAHDEADVAVHVLEYSSVLSESDLLAVVKSTREVMKLRAIARRDRVPEPVSSTLLDTGDEFVLKDLFRNKGAILSESRLLKSWNSISAKPSLVEVLVHRGGLPLPVAEKMFAAVSEELRRHLAQEYRLSSPVVNKAVNDAHEWEMLGVIPSRDDADPNDDMQVEDMIDEMHVNGRLTQSLLLRSLCVGNLGVFETGIAKLASVPRVNARILLLEGSGLGLKGIYKAAGMPEGFFEAIQMLLKLSLEETEYGRIRQSDFRKRIIDRIYSGDYHRTIENMQYLLSIIGGKIGATVDA